jgi:hypothetical protein
MLRSDVQSSRQPQNAVPAHSDAMLPSLNERQPNLMYPRYAAQ